MRGRIAFVCFGVLFAVAGVAQAGEPGVVRAQSYVPVPAGQTIEIRPQDDSFDNLDIAKVIASTLTQRGEKPVAGGGRLLLTFSTAVVAADEGGPGLTLGETSASDYTDRLVTAPQGGGAQIDSPEPHVPQGIGRQILDSDVRINLWSSSRDSLLQGRVPGSTRASTPRHILSAILADAETGQQYWRGESVLDGASVSDLATFKSMVPALLHYLARDARGENSGSIERALRGAGRCKKNPAPGRARGGGPSPTRGRKEPGWVIMSESRTQPLRAIHLA